MNFPRPALLSLAAWLAVALVSAKGQAPVPQPARIDSDAPVVVAGTDPLRLLEEELAASDFDRRGMLASAFDAVNAHVTGRVTTLQAHGLGLVDEAETNLSVAVDIARTTFRDMSLTTEETWRTARDNAILALRRIRGALEDLERTATLPR